MFDMLAMRTDCHLADFLNSLCPMLDATINVYFFAVNKVHQLFIWLAASLKTEFLLPCVKPFLSNGSVS